MAEEMGCQAGQLLQLDFQVRHGDTAPINLEQVAALEMLRAAAWCSAQPKSSIEVTICTSSNILVWFGRDTSKKSVAGLRESLISSPFAKFAKD